MTTPPEPDPQETVPSSPPPQETVTPSGVGAHDVTMDSTAGRAIARVTGASQRYLHKVDLARGGMGAVALVHDVVLRRDVARKTLREDIEPDRAVVERFIEEARITGQLAHPNIVPVYDLEEAQDGWAFTMKLIDGQPLKEVMRRLGEGEELPERSMVRRLQVFQQICHAVAFAHTRGVIHRDLKPANVIVGAFGEVVVLDWGVARSQGQEIASTTRSVPETRRRHGETVDGMLVGTPSYMSPEQAEGRVSEVDHRSDIWALGVILFELITLRRPWEGSTLAQLLMRIRDDPYALPGHDFTGAKLPVGLDAVIARALAKDRADRYPRVEALAADVQCCLEDRPVSARDDTWRNALARRLRRQLGPSIGVVAAVVGVAMICVTALGVSLGTHRTVEEHRRDAISRGNIQLELAREALDAARRSPAQRAALRAEAQRCWGRALDAAEAVLAVRPGDVAATQLRRDVLQARLDETNARPASERTDDPATLQEQLRQLR